MILAAAVRADAGVSGEFPERHTVIQAAEVARGIERAPQIHLPRRVMFEIRHAHESNRYADDQRARAAHPRRARQVALQHDIGAERRTGEVAGQPARDHLGIVTPSAVPMRIRGTQCECFVALRIDDVQLAVCAPARDDDEAARNGSHERTATRVVGVLPEHFETSRHPPGVLRLAAGVAREAAEDPIEHDGLRRVLMRIEPTLDQRGGERFGGRHGRGVTPASRLATATASARRDRSRTGPLAGNVLNLRPRPIASATASGISNSPRAERGTSRHASMMRASKCQQFMLTQG